MATWMSDELSTIGAAEELEIAPVRRDGMLRKPVTIWAARHGVDKDVALVETDNVNDEVDAEYRTNGYLAGLLPITDLARALAVGPRSGRTKVPS
jgi:hypothetical protein